MSLSELVAYVDFTTAYLIWDSFWRLVLPVLHCVAFRLMLPVYPSVKSQRWCGWMSFLFLTQLPASYACVLPTPPSNFSWLLKLGRKWQGCFGRGRELHFSGWHLSPPPLQLSTVTCMQAFHHHLNN